MTMAGLMQDWPLRVTSILDHAATRHGKQQVVSRMVEGDIRRLDYATLRERVRRCADLLDTLGIGVGERVATLAWNTHRHLELWYACAALGAVYHTVNPRLFEEQIQWIINDAEDAIVFVDLSFVPLLEQLLPLCKSVRHVVILSDRAHMPETSLQSALCYEDLIADANPGFAWRELDESAALGLCYTSGTTGRPKGVLYSHRSMVLHAMGVNAADALGLASTSVAMPVVPMYHANAWSLPFSAPMAGAKLVLPGAQLDGASLLELVNAEGVDFAAGVPTVWSNFVEHLRQAKASAPTLTRIAVGGSACSRALFDAIEQEVDAQMLHAWGMTEMSPLGSFASARASMAALSDEELVAQRLKQGAPVFGVEMRIVDAGGAVLPEDGRTAGRLQVRGAAVLREYYKGAGGQILDADGYFDTGDIATIDEHGFMRITDRAKDMIKSGGEWISSIELENAAMGHPAVTEAAAIAVPHPKWDERPLLLVVCREGASVDSTELRTWLQDRMARWALPDDVVVVAELPHTATGKLDKVALRKRFADVAFDECKAAAK